ncbi:MAG: hypothetical protein IKZ88_05045 [Neisseriaceae bacterium]|nr:hypothetical protein [Neisseriaceae bacterium]
MKNQYLLSGLMTLSSDTAANGNRSFVGVANSGKPFEYWGEQHVVDFTGIQFKEKVPVLREHDRSQVAGVCSLSLNDLGELAVLGELFNNEHGKAIIEAADSGFPWEMSIDCRPAVVSHLKGGQELTVNGNMVNGEAVILQQVTVREVSFCATGVDSQTHATVLSDKGDEMTLEEALAEIDRLTAENDALKKQVDEQKAAFDEEKNALQAEIDELKGENNQADTDAQLSSAGFVKDESGKFARLSDTTYNMLLSADKETRHALIRDLKPAEVPARLLKSDDDGVKLSGSGGVNPLIENAKSRSLNV